MAVLQLRCKISAQVQAWLQMGIAELSQAEASSIWCDAVLPAVPYNGQLTMPAVTPPATNRQYRVSHSVTAESL